MATAQSARLLQPFAQLGSWQYDPTKSYTIFWPDGFHLQGACTSPYFAWLWNSIELNSNIIWLIIIIKYLLWNTIPMWYINIYLYYIIYNYIKILYECKNFWSTIRAVFRSLVAAVVEPGEIHVKAQCWICQERCDLCQTSVRKMQDQSWSQ